MAIPSTKGTVLSAMESYLKNTTIRTKFKTYEDLAKDSLTLSGIIKRAMPTLRGVIGVPRSGMIPASIIATALGVPLLSFSKGKVVRLDGGLRMEKNSRQIGPLVLVEDSINQGESLLKHLELIDGGAKTAVVYTTPLRSDLSNFYTEVLPLPHYFAWHMFGSSIHSIGNFGFDLDGVLCKNPTPTEYVEPSPQYDHFVLNAHPLHLPKPATARLILTARLERYRGPTEAWLGKHGIKYQSLIMGPWETPRERSSVNLGNWKASVLARHSVSRFIESDQQQAQTIARALKMCVICTDTGEVF